MTWKPIDLSEYRDKPDSEHVVRLTDGKWFKFSASYKNDDKQYVIHFWAKDMADAEEHIKGIRETLKLDGQVYVMMGHREKIKGAAEEDCFLSWRKLLCYMSKPRVTHSIKKKFSRRVRKEAKNATRVFS